jgi:hypothetical protein
MELTTIMPLPETLPVEDAWMFLADGMHVHRWYLHVGNVVQPPAPRGVPFCGTLVEFTADDPADLPDMVALARAEELIDHAELAHFVRLGLAEVTISATHKDFAPFAVSVAPTAGPLAFAAAVVGATAANWLRLFELLGTSTSRPVRGMGEWHRASIEEAERGIDLAVRIRLYEAIATRTMPGRSSADAVAERTGADLASARAELAAMHADAASMLDTVYTAAKSLRLLAFDLLMTQFPGPDRFAKYRDGGGPGQG